MDPRSQTRPPARPRTKSGFSFRSSSSNNSHKRKESLIETAAEKRKTHMSETTKANPNAAINEAQPIALALEKPTLSSLQNIKCNDIHGNPINDPDRSNPTRWRMERPLETIRSFDLAIDRAFANRQSSYYQNGAPGPQSRRTSGYWGANQSNAAFDQGRSQHSTGPTGVYGSTRDSYGESGHSVNGYNNGYNNGYYNGHNSGHNNNGYGNRGGMQSDPALSRYGAPGVYPAVGSRSKDTLNTGGSSGSEAWHNSTGPTSEESSLERANGVTKPMQNQHQSSYTDYGMSEDERNYPRAGYPPQRPGMGMTSSSSTNMLQNGGGYYPPQDGNRPPQPPAKDPRPQPPAKNTISLNSSSVPTGAVKPVQSQRQSWFKRRFSKDK